MIYHFNNSFTVLGDAGINNPTFKQFSPNEKIINEKIEENMNISFLRCVTCQNRHTATNKKNQKQPTRNKMKRNDKKRKQIIF